MRIKKTVITGLLIYCFGLLTYAMVHYNLSIIRQRTVSSEIEQRNKESQADVTSKTLPTITIKHTFTNISFNSSKNNSNLNEDVDPNFPLRGGLKLPKPRLQFGSIANNTDIIIGIPTIKREGADYLVKTIQSLLSNAGGDEMKAAIVVYVGEINESFVEATCGQLYREFKSQFDNGKMQIISPPKEYYPNWESVLTTTFGDPIERVKWRSKQNLDQVFLMMHIYNLSSKYYLMLEDDVIAAKGYMKKIFQEVEKRNDEDYFYISFCLLGAIGKLFRTSTLTSYATFVYNFWNKKPLDWLQVDYAKTICCSYDESEKRCQQRIASKMPIIKPSLFQHVGKLSSLKGKIQNLKDPNFKKDKSA